MTTTSPEARGQKELFDSGTETLPVDQSIEDPRGGQTRRAQSGNKSRGFPMTMRCFANQWPILCASAITTIPVSRSARFIDETHFAAGIFA
jgi:hypothetical protein